MKSFILVTSFLLISHFYVFAQKDKWTVKAGEEINELAPEIQFRYPKFVQGIVFMKNGEASQVLLNLNLLTEEMQFISGSGDTLTVDNERTIKYITINNDTFYYAQKFLELVAGNQAAKLAKKQHIKIGDVKKTGGYGQTTSTSSINTISAIYNNGRVTKLSQRGEILLEKEVTFYIGDNYNHFLEANKKNVLKLFGRHETLLENFFKENKIRFYNESDLKLLIDFLQKNIE